MKRCSFCEWIPILPMPVWPLAWQCSLGQNTVVGSMTLLLAMRGNMTTRSMSGPRLLYNFIAPRLGVELSAYQRGEKPKAFTFLGMTFFCGKTRHGPFKVKRKTSRKKLQQSLARFTDGIRRYRNLLPTGD